MSTANVTVGNVFEKQADVRSYAEDTRWVLPSCSIGVEIEIEGCASTLVKNNKLWDITQDNSLREVNNCAPYEIRFAMPLCGKDLTAALDTLEKAINTSKSPPIPSSRTSVHVHIDARDMHLYHLLKFIVLYVIFEKVLFNFCGIDREDNIFCLPFYKAEGFTFANFSSSILTSTSGLFMVSHSEYRYSALNMAALRKFGTLEFRHMGGTNNVEKIRNWVNLIMCLKKAAMAPEQLNLKDIPQSFSNRGIEVCTKEVFGNYHAVLTYYGMNMDILQGIRLAQDIIYRDNLQELSNHIRNYVKEHSQGLKKYAQSKNVVLPAINLRTEKVKSRKAIPEEFLIVVPNEDQEET